MKWVEVVWRREGVVIGFSRCARAIKHAKAAAKQICLHHQATGRGIDVRMKADQTVENGENV